MPNHSKGDNIPHACYASEYSANNGALLRVRWGEFRTIEVVNVDSGRELGTYKQTADGHLTFTTSDATMIRLLKERNSG